MIAATNLAQDARDACISWSSNECHLDDGGNYRLRNGKVAPWNRSARIVYRGNDELHSVSQKSPAERDEWIDARVSGVDTLRIDTYGLRDALQSLQRHDRVIAMAIEALGPRIEPGDAPAAVVTKALALIESGWRPSEPWAEVFG